MSRFDRRARTLQLCGLMLAVAMAVGLQARESTAPVETYPYRIADSLGGGCGYDYIDLQDVGETLVLSAVAGDPDDAGAVLELAAPFEFYQQSHPRLVVSGNGYLAAVGSLAEDSGGDFANACALPGNAVGPAGGRILAYHDDLRPQAGGSVRHAHFPACPRPPTGGGSEACTVVEWSGFERVTPLPSSNPLHMQAVLYHHSREIALQYASLDDSHAASATIGVRGLDGQAARDASCNFERRSLARSAVCFFDPRSAPPRAR